jgi:Methyltransferase domain
MIKGIHATLQRWPWLLLPAYTAMIWMRRPFWRFRQKPYPVALPPQSFVRFVSSQIRGQAFVCVEFGCNSGATLFQLARNFPTATFLGVDLQGSAIRAATDAAREAGLTNVSFLQSDILKALARLQGDYVISCATLIYLDPQEIRKYFKTLMDRRINHILIQDIGSTTGKLVRRHYFAHPYPEMFRELGVNDFYRVDVQPIEYQPWIGPGFAGFQIVLSRRTNPEERAMGPSAV